VVNGSKKAEELERVKVKAGAGGTTSPSSEVDVHVLKSMTSTSLDDGDVEEPLPSSVGSLSWLREFELTDSPIEIGWHRNWSAHSKLRALCWCWRGSSGSSMVNFILNCRGSIQSIPQNGRGIRRHYLMKEKVEKIYTVSTI
jgi:hypothetical protein